MALQFMKENWTNNLFNKFRNTNSTQGLTIDIVVLALDLALLRHKVSNSIIFVRNLWSRLTPICHHVKQLWRDCMN